MPEASEQVEGLAERVTGKQVQGELTLIAEDILESTVPSWLGEWRLHVDEDLGDSILWYLNTQGSL